MGEEVHDAIATATDGVFAKYTPRGFGNTVTYAMQMPDTSEPSKTEHQREYLRMLRGNRDNVPRDMSPTILQSGALMGRDVHEHSFT